MGWEDRPYYRDRPSGPMNPLQWLASGFVSLGVWFGIDVRIHATFIVYIAITLLLPGSLNGMKNAATSRPCSLGSCCCTNSGIVSHRGWLAEVPRTF